MGPKEFVLALISAAVLLGGPSVSRAEFIQAPPHRDQSKFPPLEKHFIQPNEWFDGLYESEVKDLTGAMISVGTFRAFQKILYGNFTWAFIVDVDPIVARFNELNYQAILQAKSLRHYLENFPEFYASQYRVYPKGFDSANEDFQKSRPLFQFMQAELRDSVFFVSGKEDRQHAKYFKPFFFNNENQFQEMKSKLAKTNIVSVVGSFTDHELAQKIQTFLKSQNVQLSLLDISNVLDYVLPAKTSSADRRHFTAEMLRFTQALDLAQSKILFTTSLAEQIPILNQMLELSHSEENVDTFRYYVATSRALNDLLSGAKTFTADKPEILTLENFAKPKAKSFDFMSCSSLFGSSNY